MKFRLSFVLLSIAACAQVVAFAQNPPDARIITFNRNDTAHCRVITATGKPLLESTYEGISVAIGLPVSRGDGEFAVFVSIYQGGEGTAHVVPKDFSAVFSDPAHTRFPFFDKAAEVEAHPPTQSSAPGMSAQTNQIDSSMMRGGPPRAAAAGLSPSDTLKGDDPPPNAGQARPPVEGLTVPVFLARAKLKQGSKAAGMVYFRKPKGSKLEVNPTDMLDEIDLPINGIVFRF